MNHIYRVVFNHSLGVYQCVSELAKTCGKSSGKSSTSTSNNNFALRALSTALFSVLGLSIASVTHAITYDNGAVNMVGNGYTIVDDIVKNDSTILKNNDDDVNTNYYMQMNGDQEIPSRLLITDNGVVQTDQLQISNNALVNIEAGGRLEANDIYTNGFYSPVNQQVSGDIRINVNGSESLLQARDSLAINARNAQAITLTVENGGKVESNYLQIYSYIDDSQGSQLATGGKSSVYVNGLGSSLNIQDQSYIVSQGSTSTLTVENGGKVEMNSLDVLAFRNIDSNISSNSIVNISGNGTSLSASNLYVSSAYYNGINDINDINDISININDAAVLNTTNTYIASSADVDTKVSLVSGAQWNNEEALYIGVSDSRYGNPTPETELETAFLEIGGKDTKVSTMDLFVGAAARGKGQVDVTDQGKLEVTRQLQLGGSDTEGANAVGELTVDNATLIAPVTVVGAFGSGTLNVVNNGVVNTQNIERFENSVKSEVNFDNGTLELTEFQPELFRNFTGDNLINLGAGGGTIDTAGFNARLFENTMLAGSGAVITGAGDFTKKGTGMLAMATTAKQWTGATNIKQGTLSLDGDYTMRDGEILGISLNSLDDYGQLVVTGAADISQGQLQVDASEAVTKMTGSNEWTDIISASSRTGEFTAINDNSPLVSFEADYSNADAVNLKMIVPVVTPEPPVVTPEPPVVTPEPPVVTPEPPVVTPEPPVTNTTFLQSVISRSNRNDTGIAYVLDKAIQDRVTNGDNALADSLISSTLNFNQSQLATAANQLQPLFMGATNRIITDANYAASDAIQEHSQTVPQRNLWAQLIGNNGSHDAEEGVTGYDSEAYGAIVGLDTPINNDLNLGVAFSYIKSDADTDGTSLDQELTAKNWQVLGYGNYAVSDATDLNFHAGLGKSDVEGERRITILTDAVAQSDYSVDTLQAGLGVAHRIGTQQRNVTPFAQVDYARAESDSYRETGAGVYNLNVDENTYESMRWTAGLRLSQALTPAIALTGQLAAAVENGDRRSDVTASFISMPNDKFTTIGQEIGSEIGIVGIGLSYTPTINTKLSVGYRGEWRDNYDSQGANVSLQTTF
ncbi:autotransporter domain-containing protein [Psychrobacter sp. NPDC078631]|uniref:autotransporter domain-containing protein n=1 Tax=Psychrobacter sp. NPDC078631 TaxID=3390666 RepID=UPI003D091B8A